MITAEQIRAARACINISQLELSELSSVAITTLHNIESESGILEKYRVSTINKLIRFFEDKGIKFLQPSEKNGDGSGIRYFPANAIK